MMRLFFLSLLFSLTFTVAARGQFGGSGADGILQPTTHITLDTTGRSGGWSFTAINIQWPAVVRLQGPYPAILRCTGTIRIDGYLVADGFVATGATPGSGGPGGYAGGQPGQVGGGPAGGRWGSVSGGWWFVAGSGGHASFYGAARPFDMHGGSGGGGGAYTWGQYGGHGGGGVVVLLADGDITIAGEVTANGGGGIGPGNAPGAGGGVLIRSASSVSVLGVVSAQGGVPPSPFYGPGDGGFVRVDSWGGLPDVQSARSIQPSAALFALPHLVSRNPLIGASWDHLVTGLPNDTVFVGFSVGTASINLGSLGVLGLDPVIGIAIIGSAAIPAAVVDPDATISFSIPADPAYAGMGLHAQAIAWLTTSPCGPRLSNVVHNIIQ